MGYLKDNEGAKQLQNLPLFALQLWELPTSDKPPERIFSKIIYSNRHPKSSPSTTQGLTVASEAVKVHGAAITSIHHNRWRLPFLRLHS